MLPLVAPALQTGYLDTRYLKLSGGTLTGPPLSGQIKLTANGNYRGEVLFDTTGALVAAPWTIHTTSFGTSAHDNSLVIAYNARMNQATGAWERIVANEHCIELGLESRWVVAPGDPTLLRGVFEYHVDVETALVGVPTFVNRIFQLSYDFDFGGGAGKVTTTFGKVGLEGSHIFRGVMSCRYPSGAQFSVEYDDTNQAQFWVKNTGDTYLTLFGAGKRLIVSDGLTAAGGSFVVDATNKRIGMNVQPDVTLDVQALTTQLRLRNTALIYSDIYTDASQNLVAIVQASFVVRHATAPYVGLNAGTSRLGFFGFGFGATDFELSNEVAAGSIKLRTGTNKVRIQISSAGAITIGVTAGDAVGFFAATPVTRPTALTVQLTTITHTAPGTPDYAIQDFVDVSLGAGWAFKSHDEANSVLAVIANLQTRLGELEDKLGNTAGLGLITH